MNIFTIILIQPLANGLAVFYRLLGENMGLAIIGFSFALRLLLNPLTKPYMESMKKMKEIEPLVAKLKKKYANDSKGLMQAQTELYRQKGINPGAGCLPYVLQIVVLIALFNVFNRVLKGGDLSVFNNLLYPALKFPEGAALNTHFLYLDITKPDIFHIPGLPFPVPGPLLFVAAFLQYIASEMMTPFVNKEEALAKKTTNQVDDMQVSMQQSMKYTFPLFTLVFGVGFPSGLALYWLLFSVFQVWQQYRTSGWGGLTPFFRRFGLLKSVPESKK